MRVVFAGSPEFSVPCLAVLWNASNVDVVGVFTQPDRPSGRGKVLTPGPVKAAAEEYGIPIYQPESFKLDSTRMQFEELKPDLFVVVAYGLILPEWVLGIPSKGCLNVHASLLPRWRGAAPIQRAIEAGDSVTGVTLMEVEPELDSGPILATLEAAIEKNETGGSLHDKLSGLGARLLKQNLDGIQAGTLVAVPQNEYEVTYAKKLSRRESNLNWHQDALTLERKVRAFNPWPAANTSLENVTLKILDACEAGSGNGERPGTVVQADKSEIQVQTGSGLLALKTIQKPGGKPMSAGDFLNGTPIAPGVVLGASE